MCKLKNIIVCKAFKVLVILFALVMFTTSSTLYAKQSVLGDEDIDIADGFDPWKIEESKHNEIVKETTYFDVQEKYLKSAHAKDELIFKATDSLLNIEDKASKSLSKVKVDDAVKIPARSIASFEIDVPDSGAWHIALVYRVLSANIVDLKIDIKINDEKPFFEADDISLPSVWKVKEDGKKIDSYNNQIYPASEHIVQESMRILNHDMFYLNTPLLFNFNSGKNLLSISNNELEYELIEIKLLPKESLPTYDEYLNNKESENAGEAKLVDAKLISIEAEKYTSKNRVHIRGERTRDYNFHPYSSEETLINIISPNMWQNPGDSLSYKFYVDTEGYYRIGLRYQQDSKRDMSVYKNICLDGETPFEELNFYPFTFTRSEIKNEFLKNENGEFLFYLSKGEHELKITSTASGFFEPYELLSRVISEMNQISLDIKTITGNRVDKNREWKIEQYIPELRDRLDKIANAINVVYKNLLGLSRQDRSTSWNNLQIIEQQIRLYLNGKDGLDRLVNNLDGFSMTDGSLAQQLSSIIDDMLLQPLTIDQIYIAGESLYGLPKKIGFFEGIMLKIKNFFNSFKTQSTETLTLEDDALNIWVNRPITHIDVLREMINQYYPNKNIKINLSAMPDENRLLLAIIGGTAPDGVLGLSTGKPYDFALRSAAYDLRHFNDFKTSVEDFTADMFLPFAYNEGIYAMPETTTFSVFYYRTDILQKLGLEVPRTWDDIIDLVPALDRNGMNVQTLISANDAYKPFSATVPMIQQFEGEVYNSDGKSVSFNHPKTLEAFELLTDLYVKYNLPHRIVNFYNNFKSGVTPIGVSDLNTYTLLKYAAPEIRGQWAIAPSIGVEDSEGNIINTQPVVTSACMITEQSEKKEEMWELMKWWMSSETQLRYGNELQMRFGKEYFWSSANLETISNAPYFEEEEKKIIYDHIFNAREIPRHPAYFQVERELSDAWNRVVFDGITVREALDKAALSSNRVMLSKLQEFSYLDNEGNQLKKFEIPSVEKIRKYANFADSDDMKN